MKTNRAHLRGLLLVVAALLTPVLCSAQLVATGVINGTLIHKTGIALIFNTASGGVPVGGAQTSTASLNFGTISAYGVLSPNVTRTNVPGTSFTVSTPFAVQVIMGGTYTYYNLTAQLAATAPTGLAYKVDTVTLTTASKTVQTNASFNTDIVHTLYLVVSTDAPGSGGPVVGTALSDTINFTATAH